MITNEMLNKLMNLGMTQQQANSKAVEILIDSGITEDDQEMLKEADRRLGAMEAQAVNGSRRVRELEVEVRNAELSLAKRIGEAESVFLAAKEAADEHGTLSTDTARETVALYGALIKMGGGSEQALKNAGYIVYAFLGGQAREVIAPGMMGMEDAD